MCQKSSWIKYFKIRARTFKKTKGEYYIWETPEELPSARYVYSDKEIFIKKKKEIKVLKRLKKQLKGFYSQDIKKKKRLKGQQKKDLKYLYIKNVY